MRGSLGKSPGERIYAPGLGQSDLRSLEIFGEPLNKGSPGSSCKGLDAEANSKGREIALEEDGGKGIDPFFYAQMLISLLLVRVLESEGRTRDDYARVLVKINVAHRVR